MGCFADDRKLAENLRLFLLRCPERPVNGKDFNLDALGAGKSMSLQLNPAQTLTTYIDGSRVVRQPFTLYLGATAKEMNESKSALIGGLNAFGYWLDGLEEAPEVAAGYKVIAITQTTGASIYQEDNARVVYSAQFLMDYEETK